MTLRVEKVCISYGAFQAVSDASLTVPDGKIVGLIGPNGAGKSTLFSAISGLIVPSSGSIAYRNEPLGALSPVKRARRGIGRTFQVPREFPGLSVRENLLAAIPNQIGERLWAVLSLRKRLAMSEDANRATVSATLEEFGLQAVAENLAGNLSGGQKKLLELARIWLTRPTMLLLDEPFSGVNPVLIETISGHIRRLNSLGVGCLIVEHNIPALARLVEGLTAMDRGRTIASGSPDEVLAHPQVREAYLGRAA